MNIKEKIKILSYASMAEPSLGLCHMINTAIEKAMKPNSEIMLNRNRFSMDRYLAEYLPEVLLMAIKHGANIDSKIWWNPANHKVRMDVIMDALNYLEDYDKE